MTKARDLADLNFASPELTGTPIAPTAAAGTNTTQIATTAFVGTGIANLVDSSPDALNTLNELAAALGDDANFSTTVTNSIATKAPLASPTFTGTATVPTLNSTTAIQMGGTEVLNSSRQLSNIASIDATTATAIGAAGIGGGGSIELTASENIAAGDVVVLNSSGQSSKVGYSADSDTVSEETLSVSSLTSNWSHGAWDQDQNKLLIVHSPSGYSKAVVGTPSGYSMSFGSEVSIFNDPNVGQHVVRYDTNYNQFIGIHSCAADSTGKYFVGTISGTSFVVDTSNSNFEGSESTHLDMTIDQANAKVFVTYRHQANSGKGTILCGTINDGSVSWGSGHVFQNSFDTESPQVIWNDTIGYVFVASKWGNGNAQQYYCATVSGTSFTDRFMYNEGSNCSSCAVVHDTANSTASKGVQHVVRTGSGGSYIQAVEIDTNYSITTRSWQNFTTSGIGYPQNGNYDFWYDEVTDLMYLVTNQGGEKLWIFKYNPANYTYDVTSFGDFNTTAVGTGERYSIAQDTTNGTIYIPHQGVSSTTPSYALSVQALSVSDASSFLGISQDTVTSGNTHNVTVISGVNENVSGLTPGARYYVGGDGSLQTTDNGNKIGKALASNKLYIDSAGA